MYKAKQVLGEVKFQCYVVCRKCFSIYQQCIETSGIHRKSKQCSFKQFPFHPQLRMRSSCGTLLKSIELASKKTYLYPFLMYCYLGLDVSLQSILIGPIFSMIVRSGDVDQLPVAYCKMSNMVKISVMKASHFSLNQEIWA